MLRNERKQIITTTARTLAPTARRRTQAQVKLNVIMSIPMYHARGSGGGGGGG